MKMVLFSKALKDKSPEELVALALSRGIDGYDLCVRPGYPVNPDNVEEALPQVAKLFRKNNLDISMVTSMGDLLSPDHPTVRPMLGAMDKADVRLLKLGYFRFDPETGSYKDEVEQVRRIFAEWEDFAREYRVKICYHTHSQTPKSKPWMGMNCSALAHLISGFDPNLIGAYIDPGHLAVNGEDFATAVSIIRDHLSAVAVKDVLLTRGQKNAHGYIERSWVEAGRGMVDWTDVFECLSNAGFDGPISIHCEFRLPQDGFVPAVRREIAFFKRLLER